MTSSEYFTGPYKQSQECLDSVNWVGNLDPGINDYILKEAKLTMDSPKPS